MSPTGSWVAYCQSAREGEPVPIDERGRPTVSTELMLQVGERSSTIDALFAWDPRGRYLVTYHQGHAWLVDAVDDRHLSLDGLQPDLRFDALADHRSFAFSSDGKKLFVLARPDDAAEAVGRVLDVPAAFAHADLSKHCAEVRLPDGHPWRVQVDGQLAVFTVSSGAWPVGSRSEPKRRCSAGITPFAAFLRDHPPLPDASLQVALLDATSTRLDEGNAPLTSSPAPGYVMSFGSAWVRRSKEGRLLLVEGKTQRQLASERCGARVLHADLQTGLFLVSCEEYEPVRKKRSSTQSGRRKKPRYRFDLYLLEPGHVVDLEADLMRTGVDMRARRGPRFVPLRPGRSAALVDFQRQELIRLDEGVSVVASSDHGALLRQGQHLSLFDGSEIHQLEPELPPLTRRLQSDFGVALGGLLYEWETSTFHRIDDCLVVLGDDGHRLIAPSCASSSAWATGPMVVLPAPKPPSASDAK